MKEIDIEESKLIQLDIMQDIHDFCQARGIRYALGYGTLLGAVRHGGFIPWDDDIDILMPRVDYERFVAEYNDGHSSRYRLHSLADDPSYGLPFAKVEDSRTLLVEKVGGEPMGIAIDVFPVDPLKETQQQSEAYFKKVLRARNLYKGKMLRPTPLNSTAKKIAIKLLNILTAPLSLPAVARWYERKCRKGTPGAPFAAVTVWGYGLREIMPSALFEKFKPIKFEDREFITLADTDGYLSRLYGDYMTPPPPDKRHSPHTHLSTCWRD
ncbi:MAG: LicD family protein [Candidatus Amulumruptor caecigallinarius]|nr:LicD family protein [Candidatus Amulumruptor caecigallinarius]MCM1397177.1 LicD family protein [Candidatus Amulumruptor caecigallinarius]MCM1453134.1 LicD family protein [bacterium]